jgi:enterobactin synthetase component D
MQIEKKHKDILLNFISNNDLIKVGNIPKLKLSWSIVNYNPQIFPLSHIDYQPVEIPLRLQNAVASRKADFLAGRLAAYTALKKSGSTKLVVESSPQGVPIWPQNWKGSISHSFGRAIAVCVPNVSGKIIGVDCERIVSNNQHEFLEYITNIDERNILNCCNLDYDTATIIVFSAKESLFKALWPDVKKFFDFSAARLQNLDLQNQTFQLKLCESLHPFWIKDTLINGHFYFDNEYVTTLVCS